MRFNMLRTRLAAVLLFGSSLYAQFDRGAISGFVKDASSAAVSGANVTIRDEASGVSTRVKSNETGYFQAPNLTPGLYTVEVEAAGFRKYSEQHVKLDADSAATVNVSMQIGAVTESVEVVASSAQVQAESAQVGRVVEAKQISDM